MPQVYQFAELSMGWCINCHRESRLISINKETAKEINFYSIYEKFHNDIKAEKWIV